jgi:hypothetical protein
VRLASVPTSVSRLSRESGILDVSQIYGPSWPVTEIDLLSFSIYVDDYFCCSSDVVYVLSLSASFKLYPVQFLKLTPSVSLQNCHYYAGKRNC